MLPPWSNTSEEYNLLPSDDVLFLQHHAGRPNVTYNDHAAPRRHHYSIFLICMVLTVSLTFGLYWRRIRKCQPKVLPVDAVHALSAVFTPTSNAWPAKFAYYFESASITPTTYGTHGRRQEHLFGYGRGQGVIEVDLSALMGYILAGDIELRDPSDLGPLLEGSLKMYAWNIRLRVGWDWWLEVARWLAVQHVLSANRLSLQIPAILTGDSPNFIDLDFIAFQNLEYYMGTISNRHQSSSSITVEFSSIKPEIRFMSSNFLLCAIALLPAWKGSKPSHGFTRYKKPIKMSTPLFVQLGDVVACITSTKSFKITSITSISAQREASLLSKERDLIESQDIRTRTVRETDIRGWREERLRLAWEAGLIRAGLLHRWSIQLSKG